VNLLKSYKNVIGTICYWVDRLTNGEYAWSKEWWQSDNHSPVPNISAERSTPK
jgi:hypothetical protein